VPVTLRTLAWIACVIYSTIPSFWLMIHPHANFWRSRQTSPYKILLPVWIATWVIVAAVTAQWRDIVLYETNWSWIPAGGLFGAGLILYKLSHGNFTLRQLGGMPEILPGHNQQHLVTTGIRARVRHPIYLGHLCEMLAWSAGSGLAVCWALTGFAVLTGAIMIRMEDDELEKRFGEEYRYYRATVPAIFPRILNESRLTNHSSL
jgi:protein-S-isoprenylcysteine O-methyltransferase Ste14